MALGYLMLVCVIICGLYLAYMCITEPEPGPTTQAPSLTTTKTTRSGLPNGLRGLPTDTTTPDTTDAQPTPPMIRNIDRPTDNNTFNTTSIVKDILKNAKYKASTRRNFPKNTFRGQTTMVYSTPSNPHNVRLRDEEGFFFNY